MRGVTKSFGYDPAERLATIQYITARTFGSGRRPTRWPSKNRECRLKSQVGLRTRTSRARTNGHGASDFKFVNFVILPATTDIVG